MALQPERRLEVRNFQGMADNVDRRDLPEGAAWVQVNLTCLRPSELQARGGWRPVTFEAEA